LLSNQTVLTKTELDKSMENIELTLKFCPPSYCDNTMMITVLPLKLAELEFAQKNFLRAQQLLDIVERNAQQSTNATNNTWLQQVRSIQENIRLQHH
jgi:hypothetical protein